MVRTMLAFSIVNVGRISDGREQDTSACECELDLDISTHGEAASVAAVTSAPVFFQLI